MYRNKAVVLKVTYATTKSPQDYCDSKINYKHFLFLT